MTEAGRSTGGGSGISSSVAPQSERLSAKGKKIPDEGVAGANDTVGFS
jgi:hypothetical protein